ncbi:hypothetical protein JMJ35_010467 [Cladonia borealis]|uniref:Uncharacterized protein n=1 Tax=Cladonia borealis TaxID=184061 RepID=A0AA39QRC3_9LECA|nr:hypothetical protein JMJ35_010467 [Cladonia borealis]
MNAIGHKTCVTTSINGQCDCTFSHCNDNVFSYFKKPDSTASQEIITIETPFVYIPPDPRVGAEAFGFVPQPLINSMAQDPGYLEKYPQLVSCLPGGPTIADRIVEGFNIAEVHTAAKELTSSATVTIYSNTCYNQGPCPTLPAPGVYAQAPTPDVTGGPTTASILASNPQPSDGMSTPTSVQTDEFNPPMALAGVSSNPYPPVTTAPVNPTLVKPAPKDPAAENSVPQKADGQTPEDELLNAGQSSLEQESQPGKPAALYQPTPQNQALASIVVNAIGGAPVAAANPNINQDTPPEPQPAPSYVVSLAPSASAVVINGVTSLLPDSATAGAGPIVTINSQPATLSVVPGLTIDGQNVIAGAPAATIQGVQISLAPSASAIVVDGSTTPLSPGQTPVITLGSQPVTASPTSQYVLGGRALVPGAAAITISGTPISVPTDGNAVVVRGSTVAIPDAASPVLPVITLGNQVITANSASQFLVGDQTLVPGAPAITVAAPASAVAAFSPSPTALTVGGEVFTPNPTAFSIGGTTISAGGPGVTVDWTSISLGSSGILHIGSSMISLPVNEVSPTAYTIGGQVFTPNPSAFSIDGTTISAGGPGAMVDGTIVSLGPSGILEIGSSTISLGLNAASPTPTAYTIGNQVFTPNPTAFSIDGTTISAGGPGVTIDGTIVSLGSSGILDIGRSTISLSPGTAYTVGGQIFTPNPTAFSIDGTTISAGGPGVNIDGTLVTLEASGFLDIGSSKILLPPNNVYTVGGETFTPNPTAFSIDGTTISAGGPGVTIDGTVVSLGASGILDIGSSMISLPSGNADTLGNPIILAPLGVLDTGNSTIPLTTGIPALTTTTPGPGPRPTSSSSQPRSTHSGGEAHSSQLGIGRLGIIFVLTCVVMLR